MHVEVKEKLGVQAQGQPFIWCHFFCGGGGVKALAQGADGDSTQDGVCPITGTDHSCEQSGVYLSGCGICVCFQKVMGSDPMAGSVFVSPLSP